MAGKGGGAWKVAYADFVTAMMAFFLVMWICSQDQKFRQAVARYFNNPAGIGSFGSAKAPFRPGSILEASNGGEVPNADSLAFGQGRDSHNAPGEPSPPTKLMSDWLHHDKKLMDYWQSQAQKARGQAALSLADRTPREQQEDATLKLARQLREETVQGFPSGVQGVYQDLLFRAVAEVNWLQLADDIMRLKD
jgi:chemotaxis protein MotB